MKPIFYMVPLCAGFLSLAGCDSDDPVVIPPETPPVEIVVSSSDYLNHRFFKLDLPEAEFPGGRNQGDMIIPESIRIYQLQPDGAPEPMDITNIAAYVDSLGFRNWDGIDFSDPHVRGHRWREIPSYKWSVLLEQRYGSLIALDLEREMSDQDVLAVVYEVQLADGQMVRVGDSPGLDDPQQEVNGGDGLYYRMKLLKASIFDQEPFTFRYVLRNIYSLGTIEIDPSTFDLRIERNVPGTQLRFDESGLDYIRIFGLDRYNIQADGGPDGQVDMWDPQLFDLAKGLLKFPLDSPMPFAPGGRLVTAGDPADLAAEAFYTANADTAAFVWNPSYLRDYQAWQIYHPNVLPSEYPWYGAFRIITTIDRPDIVSP